MACLDGEPDGAPDGEEAYSTLRRGASDHNHWLSLATVCVAGRLRLDQLLSELDATAAGRNPVVHLAVTTVRRLTRSPGR